MYSRCIRCNAPLGRNDVLEQFPVGRRLAFDSRVGRLWVVCSACRSWNLAPIEERWEAVETAERLFERATVGASTENVALARVSDGTELVRIGRVERPELAFWRYGRRLVGRWRGFRRSLWISAGIGGVAGAVTMGSLVYVPIAAGAGLSLLRARRAFMRTEAGAAIRLSDARGALLLPARNEDGWSLSILRPTSGPLELAGDEGRRALRGLLPQINLQGGHPDQVRNAIDEVERLGSSARVLREAAVELADAEAMDPRYRWIARPHRLLTAHPVIQLALEMAVNEESERRALEGEVALLEREWREAEEVAAIADDLLYPRALTERVRRWRAGKDLSPP